MYQRKYPNCKVCGKPNDETNKSFCSEECRKDSHISKKRESNRKYPNCLRCSEPNPPGQKVYCSPACQKESARAEARLAYAIKHGTKFNPQSRRKKKVITPPGKSCRRCFMPYTEGVGTFCSKKCRTQHNTARRKAVIVKRHLRLGLNNGCKNCGTREAVGKTSRCQICKDQISRCKKRKRTACA
jgi:predicted nucleic acid-binding Zn ribbon protein